MRHTARRSVSISAAEIAELQDAVGSLDELLDAALCFVELAGRQSEKLYAFFEEGEGPRELEPATLQLGDDLVKTSKVGFERHSWNITPRLLEDKSRAFGWDLIPEGIYPIIRVDG